MSLIARIPTEILSLICGYTSLFAFGKLAITSKHWNKTLWSLLPWIDERNAYADSSTTPFDYVKQVVATLVNRGETNLRTLSWPPLCSISPPSTLVSGVDAAHCYDLSCQFPQLQHLILRYKVTQNCSLPNHLAQLSNLQYLHLTSAYLTTDEVEQFKYLVKLQELILENISLQDSSSLRVLSELSRLTKLTLSYRKFPSSVDSTLPDQLYNLQELRVGFCKCIGSELTSYRNLRRLAIESSDIRFESLLEVASQLEYLSLASSSLILEEPYTEDNLPQHLERLSNLTYLCITSMNPSLSSMLPFHLLSNLTQLSLDAVSADDVNNIGCYLTNLKELTLEIEEASLEHLAPLTNLHSLHLSWIDTPSALTSDEIQTLATLTNLTSLSLVESSLTGSALAYLAQRLTKIRTLHIDFCEEVDYLKLSSLKNLQSFGADGCTKLASLGDLWKITTLNHLSLACETFFDFPMLTHLTNLQDLNTQSEINEYYDAEVIVSTLLALTNLKTLFINTSNLTDDHIATLQRQLRFLQRTNIRSRSLYVNNFKITHFD